MTSPITSKSVMTREEVDRIVAAIENRGGSISVTDPRMSSLIGWAGVVIGALAVAAITWGVSTMQELNLKVGILIIQHEQDAKRNDEQDSAIREQGVQIRALERGHDH